MLAAGYLVTKSEMDGWCEQRPSYSIFSYASNRVLCTQDIVNNYFATSTRPITEVDPSDGLTKKTVPLFNQIAKIFFHTITITNNDSIERSFRIAYWVYGTNEGAALLTDYFAIPSGASLDVSLEGLTPFETYNLRFDILQPQYVSGQPMYITIGSWDLDVSTNNVTATSATSIGYREGFVLVGNYQFISGIIFLSFYDGQDILL